MPSRSGENVGVSLAHDDALVILGLLVGAGALLAAAPALRIPYPILLVLGGLAIAFVPGMPEVELPPELVLVAFLPPLLYGSAFFTSLRDLRANVRAIGMLAVGLVAVTTLVVAVVAHAAIEDLPWSVCFVLGAIVSPTDPVASTAIADRLGVPRRITAVIEGESLINDGTALVAYRFAVAAVLTGSFSLWEVAPMFVVTSVGGVAVGLGVGWVLRRVRRRLDNPPAEITISLMTGFLAYIPADLLGVSAVLAAVTAGIYLGWHAPELTTVQVRLQGLAVWEIVIFVLNAFLFGLIGLQLPAIVDGLSGWSAGQLLAWAALVSAAVILTRVGFVYLMMLAHVVFGDRARREDPVPAWGSKTVVGWTGMRGAVSLAAALALPATTDAGDPFPGRDLVIFLAFSVILATLVLQGLTLPPLIRLLGLEDDGKAEREEAKARILAAEAALARLEELVVEDWVRDDTAERMRGLYGFRRDRFVARLDDGDDGRIEERSAAYQRLRRELLEAERVAVVELRREGRIGDDVMRRVQRDLDLEDSRLDI
jgi:monovalent cation/hydrogen antiporter